MCIKVLSIFIFHGSKKQNFENLIDQMKKKTKKTKKTLR